MLQRLVEDLRDRGQLVFSEAFIDASFSSAKKGVPPSALLAAVRAAESWRSATAMVLLSPSKWASASPREVRLVDATLAASLLDTLPARLIGDRDYDSDELDAPLATTYSTETIAAPWAE